MAIHKKLFAIVAVSDTSKMAGKLASAFPEVHLKIAEGQWLVVEESTTTTTEVSQKLRIVDETIEGGVPADSPGNAIILSISNYFGRAPANTWEWITAKLGGADIVAG
jgi:hypothetical protein